VQGFAFEGLGIPDLQQRPRVEDVDAVARRERDAEIVRDQDQPHPSGLLDRAKESEDLGLGRDVESRGGLVGDQQLRVLGERRPEGDPLTHPAGELERVAVRHERVVDPDLREASRRLLPDLITSEPTSVGGRQHLPDVLAAAKERIQHRERILEHEGDVPAAKGAHTLLGEIHQLFALVPHAPVGEDALGEKPDDCPRGEGFARPGLADDPDRLPGPHREVGAVRDRVPSLGRAGPDPESLDLEERLRAALSPVHRTDIRS